MGEVFRAYDRRLDRHVALKRLRAEKAGDDRARRRLLREARLAARLSHPCAVHVHDILEFEEGDWIVLEWVEGQSLDKNVANGPVDLDIALTLAADVASALAAAHNAGVLHRDLKTENVVVTPDGRAKVLDFGLARSQRSEPESAELSSLDDSISGTPRAMAPEQARGKPSSPQSDLFSLGVLIYEMLTGSSPFRAPGTLATLARLSLEPHDPLPADISEALPELSDLIDRLLAKSPEDRPESAREVATALRRMIDDRSVSTTQFSRDGAAFQHESESADSETPSVAEGSIGLQLSGELRQLTVACCRLVGFEGTSDTLDPEVLYDVLPDFQKSCARLVDEWGAHLAQLQGHRLVLYFGHPQALEDAGLRAVEAMLALIDTIENSASAQRHQVHGRAGLHTGRAVVLARSDDHRRRVIPGETLDVASAMEERASAGQVVVSDSTRSLIRDLFQLRELEDQPSAVAAWKVIAAIDPQGWITSEARIPCVGRKPELQMLQEGLSSTLDGRGRAILLTGEAGVGKSRLVRAFYDSRPDADALWLRVRGLSTQRHRPLSIVHPLLHQMLGSSPRTPEREPKTQMAALLDRHAMPASETLECFSPWLDASTQPIHHQGQQQDLQEALPALLGEMSEQSALVAVIEDLQWLDPASQDLVVELIRLAASAPVLLLLTCRADFQPPWGVRAGMTRLPLSALQHNETAELLAQWAAVAQTQDLISMADRNQLLARAGGLPRNVLELARHLDSESSELSEPQLPPTLEDALVATLDRSGAAREIARIASVLGHDFLPSQLATLMDVDKDDLVPDLERLVEAGVLERQRDTGYRFQQKLLRIAALRTLLNEDRDRLLSRIADLGGGSAVSTY